MYKGCFYDSNAFQSRAVAAAGYVYRFYDGLRLFHCDDGVVPCPENAPAAGVLTHVCFFVCCFRGSDFAVHVL